ncbi:hypothetical protein BCR34DRAFT_435239, partial [Clohesyomyces aquaticus]
ASISQLNTACATMFLSNVAASFGIILDWVSMSDGTLVIFEGVTLFGYEEWPVALSSVS